MAARDYCYRHLLESFLETEFGLQASDRKPEWKGLLVGVYLQRGPLTSTLAPCQWLEQYPAADGLPYYLWDTITFDASGNEVAGVDLAGRVPWLVPKNSLFPINRSTAGAQQASEEFVITLRVARSFCIPQDGSLRAQQEISRQAAIFVGAAVGVVWMNMCSAWSMMRDVVAWTVLHSFDGTPPVEFRIKMDDIPGLSVDGVRLSQELRILQMRPQLAAMFDLLTSTLSSTSEEEWDLRSENWLTSLWTLQEAYRRPDMLLANAAFDLFSIADQTAPVPLDTLVTLILISCVKVPPMTQQGKSLIPPAHRVLLMVRLAYFNDAHPLQHLIMESERQCQGSRAEAIMSVIGCADWHRRAVSTYQVENLPVLVFGQYGHVFLQEVLQRYRLAFFGSFNTSPVPFRHALENLKPAGTMLPFNVGKSMYPAGLLAAA
ncbi:hypothetical protein BJX70DRAFT_397290 [Aspergillus crustosus]